MYAHKAQFVFTLRERRARASQAAEELLSLSVHVPLAVQVTRRAHESKAFVMGGQIRLGDGHRGMFVFSTV